METPWTLLEKVDYVPLVTQLLAQVSIGYSSQCVLIRWNEEKPDLFATSDGKTALVFIA